MEGPSWGGRGECCGESEKVMFLGDSDVFVFFLSRFFTILVTVFDVILDTTVMCLDI